MPPLKLAHASIAQQNAAFNVVYPRLVALAAQYVPQMFLYEVQAKLQEPNSRREILAIIDQALDAALNVPPPPPPPPLPTETTA